jgi:hypothetical protein
VANDAGDILMIRRTDNDNWAIPGGAIDLGESLAQAAAQRSSLCGPIARNNCDRKPHRASARKSQIFEEQRNHLDRTLGEQSMQLDRPLAEERTRTLNERFATAADQLE